MSTNSWSGHALIIGVGSYKNRPSNNVAETTVDAQALVEVLTDPRYCGYRKEQVTLLKDSSANRHSVLAALSDLAEKVTEDDTFFFFFSGHGNRRLNGSYFLPVYDTQYIDGRSTPETVINDDELLRKLRAIKTKRVLLIFNTCHAGAVSPTLVEDSEDIGQPVPSETMAALLGTGEGRIILTACREQQYSYIGPGPGTIVGRALISALRGEGVRGDNGIISAYELYLALYRQVGMLVTNEVPEHYRKIYGETQEPELTVLKGIGPFAVALYRGAMLMGEIDPSVRPPTEAAVHEVSSEESQQAYQKIIDRSINFDEGSTLSIAGNVIGGDQQITTVYGDYAKKLDKRQGVFIESGSTVSGGNIIGVNMGTTFMGAPGEVISIERPFLEQVLIQIQYAVTQAQQQGNDDLADDLDGIRRTLQAAAKAYTEGKPQRRVAKIHEAQEVLTRIAERHQGLVGLLALVSRLS